MHVSRDNERLTNRTTYSISFNSGQTKFRLWQYANIPPISYLWNTRIHLVCFFQIFVLSTYFTRSSVNNSQPLSAASVFIVMRILRTRLSGCTLSLIQWCFSNICLSSFSVYIVLENYVGNCSSSPSLACSTSCTV